MKQGREALTCQETAERLREPESGTATDVTVRRTWGSSEGSRRRGEEPRGSWLRPERVGRPEEREGL